MAYAQFSDIHYDVLQMICVEIERSSPNKIERAFDGFSRSTKCYRGLCTPFMFRHVALRGHYEDAARRISEMLKRTDLIASARTFQVDISEGDAVGFPMAATAKQLVLLLNAMPELKTFLIRLPEPEAMEVEPLFRKGKVILPKVESLAIGPNCEFAIAACPNLTTLLTTPNSWMHLTGPRPFRGPPPRQQSNRLIRAVENCARLRHIEMTERWNTSLLQVVHEALPLTKSLAMTGSAYRESLTDMLPTLSQFSNLEHLVVAEVAGLHIGFMLPQGLSARELVDAASCIYMTGSADSEVLPQMKSVVIKYEAYQRKVARTLFGIIHTLKDVWIGDLRRFERTDDDDYLSIFTEQRPKIGLER